MTAIGTNVNMRITSSAASATALTLVDLNPAGTRDDDKY